MNYKFLCLFFLIFFISLTSVSASNVYSLTSDSYSDFFDDSGVLINSGVSVDDTLDLSGDFSNKNFTLDKRLNFTSSRGDAYLENCTVLLTGNASGSSVSNLCMFDYRHFGESIVLSGSSNNHLFNNHVTCVTKGVPLVLLPGSDYNLIEFNFLNTTNDSWDGFHESLVVFASNYNIISSNLIYTGDDNGIYLSTYGRSGGVKSYYNSIINNTVVRQGDVVSAWNYGIQVMGDFNFIAYNTVYDSYRGISTTNGINNSIIGNTIVNALGDDAIFGSVNCTIVNNTLIDFTSKVGIFIDENSTVTGNHITGSGAKAISISGSNVLIKNNTLDVTGAGIYGLGKLENITIISNTLTTSRGLIIQLKKQSNDKKPNNIIIKDNTLESTASTIVDLKEANNTIIYENNTYEGKGKVVLPEQEIIDTDTSTNFDGKTHYITIENYDNYFDSIGVIRPNTLKDGDIIYFNGEFKDKFLNINTRLWIIGNNTTFYDSTFRILKRGCIIENITITNQNPENLNKWGIYVAEVNEITIRNNIINITDKSRAYGIYLLGSMHNTITNNIINVNGSDLTYAILTYETSETKISNNNITCIGTGILYNFTAEHDIDEDHTVPEIYSTYGILSIFSSNLEIEKNNVFVTSNIQKPLENNNDCTNSLVGIDIYFDSHNNIVSYNNITVKAYDPYIYGTGVLGSETGTTTSNAKNNTFSYNNINLNGTFFVSGIITGSNSLNTDIYNNIINLTSIMTSYGLTFEESQSNTAEKNIINAKSTVIYLIESYLSDNNVIARNTLKGEGSYVYGIATYQSSYNFIRENNIQGNGNNKGSIETVSHTDVIEAGNAGIKLLKDSNGNYITNNNISTTGKYSIEVSNSILNNIYNNLLKSANYTANESVDAVGSSVYNNGVLVLDAGFVSLLVDDLFCVYGGSNFLTGRLCDAYGNGLIGFHVLLKLTRLSSGASKVYDVVTDYTGTFSLAINLAVGLYGVDASFNGLTFGGSVYDSASGSGSISVVSVLDNRTGTVLSVYKFNESFGAGKSFTGVLKDLNGNPLIGHYVSSTLTRLSSGASKVYSSTTDYNGVFTISINLAPGEYMGLCSYSGVDKYAPSSGSNTITVY